MATTAFSFDRYVAGGSVVHRLNPATKVVLTLAVIVSNVLLPDGAWVGLVLTWVLVLAGALVAGLPATYTVKRSFVALPFALTAATTLFAVAGAPLFTLEVGPWRLVGTDAGAVRFGTIVLRTWVSVQMAILLVATTSVPELLHGMRHLRLPPLLVQIVAFMLRYVTVIVEEAQRLLRARDARSARVRGRRGGGTVTWRARTAGSMAGQLFLRSYERSERVYAAMQARGYRGEMQTLRPHAMHGRDWAALAAAVPVLLLLQVIGRTVG